MIEVTFSDSAGGGLKCARAHSAELGKSGIVTLGIMPEIGDISKPMFGEYRSGLMYRMLYQEQWGKDVEMKNELKRLGSVYGGNFEQLKRGLRRGEPVRVWCDSTPSSMCGLLWLSNEITKYIKHGSEVYALTLPRFSGNDGVITRYTGWSECEPDFFARQLSRSRKIKPIELHANASEWQRLVKENAPLRAVISDRVVSVPASFYDFLIRKHLGNEPIPEAVLIGKILAQNQLGVGDWWYALRIERFIHQKRIVIIEDSKRKYERKIARA